MRSYFDKDKLIHSESLEELKAEKELCCKYKQELLDNDQPIPLEFEQHLNALSAFIQAWHKPYPSRKEKSYLSSYFGENNKIDKDSFSELYDELDKCKKLKSELIDRREEVPLKLDQHINVVSTCLIPLRDDLHVYY